MVLILESHIDTMKHISKNARPFRMHINYGPNEYNTLVEIYEATRLERQHWKTSGKFTERAGVYC